MARTRPATNADIASLGDLANQFPIQSRLNSGTADRIHDPSWCVLVEVDDELDRLVGFAVGCDWDQYLTRLPHINRVAELEDLMVIPDYGGRGIGTILVRAFEDWARHKGCEVVQVGGGPASGFYEKLGYARAGPLSAFVKNL
jgi:GNAT superfamily N-acetyltransferase